MTYLGCDLSLSLAYGIRSCASSFLPVACHCEAMAAGSENEAIEDIIFSYFKKGEWRRILTFNQLWPNKFLPWIWPSEGNLNFISTSTKQLGASRIVSIGCGFGLLEWLMEQATGTKVKGVEVDQAWWHSKSCEQTFIPLEFASDFTSGYQAAMKSDALLFCYFNNEPAFMNYLKQYEGPCLIIIGPGEDRGTFTAPLPFSLPTEVTEKWVRYAEQEIDSGNDFIAIYKRI